MDWSPCNYFLTHRYMLNVSQLENVPKFTMRTEVAHKECLAVDNEEDLKDCQSAHLNQLGRITNGVPDEKITLLEEASD